MKKIIILGSGNVATNLSIALKQKGYNIIQIWSNKIENAKALANKIGCPHTNSLEKLLYADLHILAIKDDAIKDILDKLPDIKVVHTSGSIGIEVFENKFTYYGIFYPLQTFNKTINISFDKIPICIESNKISFQNDLIEIGNKLSEKVILLTSKQREKLHIAAVFACNFSNHMYAIADNILSEVNIDFKLLFPLIDETVNKIKYNRPDHVQTGPAKRNDQKVITSHIKNISNYKTKEIYKLISNSIIKKNDHP